MPEKTQAEIAFSQLEYTCTFKGPILPAGAVVGAILEALGPSGYTLSGMELSAKTPKPDDWSIVFRRTAPAVPARSLALGFGKAVITADNLDWGEAEGFIASHGAALKAIQDTGGAATQTQHLVVALHVQLKARPRCDVTAHLLSREGLSLLDGEVKFPGIILHKDKASVIIDASAGFANGLFLRITREHSGDATLQHLAEALRKDEEQVFAVLALEGVL